ncbi:transcriptional regulator family: Fungal Specific TF [Aspergillus niger]|nr:transcriptional regulator family: Fungal Specific TF [Aspergillus niger]
MEAADHTRKSHQDPFASGPNIVPSPDTSTEAQGDSTTALSGSGSIQKVPKKRTKSGCLTCRQRRIKCGEEKPICNNCIKSKRVCKGYGLRLVFKDPLGITGTTSQPVTVSTETFNVPPPSEDLSNAVSQQRQTRSGQPVLAAKSVATTITEPTPPSIIATAPHEFQHSSVDSDRPQSNIVLPRGYPALRGLADTLAFLDQQRSGGLEVRYPTNTGIAYPQGSSVVPGARFAGSTSSQAQLYAEEEREDDYYDLDTDEEFHEQKMALDYNQLSLIMACANRDQQQLRTFTTYLSEPNILTSSAPTYGFSPLNNPKAARIFLHFIYSTGPTLSVFERHPIEPSTMSEFPVPTARQGLWTYTLPLKALENHALLQAILALSSLHISFLQQAPPTVSLKHYHYALRRVSVAVGLPMRRKHISTLAATLLLGYYEVMGADHSKWNSHVAGSAQLVREIDFAGITRSLRAQRRRDWAQRQQMEPSSLSLAESLCLADTDSKDDPFARSERNINENLIGTLVGRAVNYDELGQTEDDQAGARHESHFTREDIENFRIQCDLYWQYLQQDVIQSIIGGGPLFMPYSQWGLCPPRAGMGRLDAIYGSADHLWLLLGRLTDFGVRDRKRKLTATQSTGSEWRPDFRFASFMARFTKRDPEQQTRPPIGGAVQPPSGSPSTAPPFYGMAQPRRPRHPPPDFVDFADDSKYDEERSEETSYDEAEAEWESILTAFDAFGSALGPHFMPLPADSVSPIPTPFGPALQYRTHTIAVLWSYYFAGRILLHRLHPSMPPAMMVSAKVAAPTTAGYSQDIGRIAAGIYDSQRIYQETGGLSPALGSCLIKMTVPIFCAAIQCTDPAQRDWVVTRLRSLSRKSGWLISISIANSCENAWRVAAKQGRGPPHERKDTSGYEQALKWTPPGKESYLSDTGERRFVAVARCAAAAGWAMGLLSLEDDVLNLELKDRV